MDKRNRIFISYSYSDKEYADKIIRSLRDRGVEIFEDSETINAGSYLFERLQYLYESSETVLILLSKSYNESAYSHLESDELFHIARKRKISIIPVQIENCRIPDTLQNLQTVPLFRDYERGIEKIVNKLNILPEINFDLFEPFEFQNFVSDLLKAYGFINITWEYSDHFDFGFDLSCHYLSKDPFGIKREEEWLVEIKYYGVDRFSINNIKHLVEIYHSNIKRQAKILLVTNSILTSVAEEYLDELTNKDKIPIHILDGNALKKLVVKRKSLIRKYFSR